MDKTSSAYHKIYRPGNLPCVLVLVDCYGLPIASDLQCSLLSLQRFNVAVTRARSLLIIVGNPHLLECDPNWKELINFTQKLGSYRGCQYMPRHGTESEWMEKVVERLGNLSNDWRVHELIINLVSSLKKDMDSAFLDTSAVVLYVHCSSSAHMFCVSCALCFCIILMAFQRICSQRGHILIFYHLTKNPWRALIFWLPAQALWDTCPIFRHIRKITKKNYLSRDGLSACPHGTAPLPTNRLSWHPVF